MSEKPQPGDTLGQLKELMLGEEQRAIEILCSRLDEYEAETVERLAGNLAEALNRRRSMGEREFEDWVVALQGSTEAAIERSVAKDKSRLSKILFPIIGPAIRNYMVELFRRMIQELNETIRNTTSAKRILWRVQARLAGKSYSEYVMLKTRAFRIEEVYLMQKDTGLLLLHASTNPEDEATEEADLVSGMFTAIRSFVHDSFADSDSDDEDEELDGFTFGEREVLIEVGPSMVIAAVAHGVPSGEIRDDLKAIVEDLHTEIGGELDGFDGDMARLESARPTLRRALIESSGAAAEKGGGMWRAWLFLAVILLGIGTWIFLSVRENGRWNRFETALRVEPGIALTSVEPNGFWRHRRVTGLRDPLAPTPEEIAGRLDFDLAKTTFQFDLMESLDPAFADRRRAGLDEKQRLLREEIDALKKSIGGTATGDSVSMLKSQLETALASLKTSEAARQSDLDKQAQNNRRELESLIKSQFADVEGLTIAFGDGGVAFGGRVLEPAYSSLVREIAPIAELMPVDTAGLENGSDARIAELETAIREISILFRSGSRDRGDDAKLQKLVGHINELDRIAAAVNSRYRFVIKAHPLIGTNREANRVIERTRMQQVRDLIIGLGIDAARIDTRLSEDSTKAGEGVSVEPVKEDTDTR